MTVHGVDVASYQSSTYPTDGLDFVFVKATEGVSYINEKQVAQADRARKAGLVTGFYHFLRPGDMRAQARYFVEKCASAEGDPLWADWEDPKVSCADKDLFMAEVKRLRGATHRVGLYCNLSFWKSRDTTSYCGDGLWIADPSAPAGHPRVEHPWLFHQYSISGGMDRNLGNFRDRAALRAWAGSPAAPTPTTPKEALVADASDVKTLFKTDNVLDSPDKDKDPAGNKFWTAESYLRYGYLQDRETNKLVKQLAAKADAQQATIDKLVDAIAAGPAADLDALKTEIRSAIENITVHLDVPEETA